MSLIATRPVITLDQVKHKADQIMEGRRNSVTDESKKCDESVTMANGGECVTNCDDGDDNNFCLSLVDQTLWQAAERTLTPMWEVATSAENNENVTVTSKENFDLTPQKNVTVLSPEPPKSVAQNSETDKTGNHFSHHDKVSGEKKKHHQNLKIILNLLIENYWIDLV
jgi:hypothetical protein